MTTREAVASITAQVPTELLIGGQWRPAAAGEQLAVRDPATGEVLAHVADATADDATAALAAAHEAQESWAATAPRERGELLRTAFELMIERTDTFATLITAEMGKPLADARGEVAYGAEFLRWFSEEAVRVAGRYQVAPDGRSRLLVHRRPVGPSVFITPWNFPLAMATRKVGPALAAGCTVVLKPAQLTPLTALAFADLLVEVGVPAGVVNVITASSARRVTGPLLEDSRTRKLSFTGSTPVGKALLRQAADNVLRTSMELGGNAPFLVFEDADLDEAVRGAKVAKLRNMGEACTAANRFIVHESLAREFAERLAEEFSQLRVGDGFDPASEIGPLIDGKARDGVHELVAGALRDGGRAVTGGRLPSGQGFFYPPTVLTDIPAESEIWREEIFGPVAPVATFRTEAEAVTLANAAEVGLAGYVYTKDLARTLRLSERLELGMMGVNQGIVSNPAAPFGGVKHSGLGREGGVEGIDEYLESVYVGIADPNA